ncbi:MAG TPA: ATP-dependent carboxylate-amine ligase, partial [Candidatus Tectomicrobia bacterium]
MILFLTVAKDEHANHLEPKLRERGAVIVRFDPAEFPRAVEGTLALSSAGRNRCILRRAEQEIDLSSLRAVWYRRPDLPAVHAEIGDGPIRRYVEQESKEFLHDLWNSLDCLWLPAIPFAVHRASTKGTQLKLAAELGFELPPTLITNSPAELLEFYRRHNG